MRPRLTHRLVLASSPKTRDSPLVIMFAPPTALFVASSHQNSDTECLQACKSVNQSHHDGDKNVRASKKLSCLFHRRLFLRVETTKIETGTGVS